MTSAEKKAWHLLDRHASGQRRALDLASQSKKKKVNSKKKKTPRAAPVRISALSPNTLLTASKQRMIR